MIVALCKAHCVALGMKCAIELKPDLTCVWFIVYAALSNEFETLLIEADSDSVDKVQLRPVFSFTLREAHVDWEVLSKRRCLL